jgi:hypothetical protein
MAGCIGNRWTPGSSMGLQFQWLDVRSHPGGKPEANRGWGDANGPTVCWELKRGERYAANLHACELRGLAHGEAMHNVKGFRQFAFRLAK